MGDPRGFLTTDRELPKRRPVDVRIRDWREVYEDVEARDVELQAGRCMDCGHSLLPQTGVHWATLIPEWNELIHDRDWGAASERLHATNNFPEFTGRLCPAPCETACVSRDQRRPCNDKAGRSVNCGPSLASGMD